MSTTETVITITTSKRVYTLQPIFGVWYVRYQAINAKTGRPWQAIRYVTAGHNAWRGWDYFNGRAQSEVFFGTPPSSVPEQYTGLVAGYATEADARAAVAAS